MALQANLLFVYCITENWSNKGSFR